MLRISKIALPFAGHHPLRRRRRQFTPSIGESASRLEDRALLSAAGGSAHAAMAAHNLANTPAGQHVTALFQSILHTDPTQQQVTQWVHKIRAGTSINVLKRQLIADARLQNMAGGAQAVTVSSSSASPTRVGTSAGNLPAGLTGGSSSGRVARNSIRQVPGGASLSPTSEGVGSRTITVVSPTPTRTTRTTTTPTPTTTASTTTPTSTTTSTSTIASIPTQGQTTTTGTPATIAPFRFNNTPAQFAPVTFAPITTVNSPINPSPVPINGTLPSTRTPANPSPLPATGTLPFTGTPANPSPVPMNGIVL